MADAPLLQIEGVAAAYGPVEALRDVSVRVEADEIVALLGANGAGKTTTLRTVCGLVRPTRGTVRIAGQEATRLQVEDIVRLGVVMVPEGRRVFPGLTVL